MSDVTELREMLEGTIEGNNFAEFVDLVDQKRIIFNRLEAECGTLSLVRLAIEYNSEKIFDYLLPFQTSQQLFSVLSHFYWNTTNRKYFARALIENGAPLEALRHTEFLGCINGDTEMLTFLLSKDLDPNVTNKDGTTLLHLALHHPKITICMQFPLDEIVATLLCYGADPSKESRCKGLVCKYNAFELACKIDGLYYDSDFIFEQLMLYTFDNAQQSHWIRLPLFIKLAAEKEYFSDTKKLLIDSLLDYHLDFVIDENLSMNKMALYADNGLDFCYWNDCYTECCVSKLFVRMDFACFKYLAERCPKGVCAILEETTFFPLCLNKESSDAFLQKMEYLISKDNFYFNVVVNFFENLDAFNVCCNVVQHLSESKATRLILFMIEYGLQCNSGMYHAVYRKFGDCVLFRTLLHLDATDYSLQEEDKSAMATFISDIYFSVHTFGDVIPNMWKGDWHLQTPFGRLLKTEAINLLNFSVHPKLICFLLKTEGLPKWVSQKIQLLPKVPSLQELARGAVRKHLVDTFKLKTTRQFYSLISGLPIPKAHKKIITLETRLYSIVW